MDGETKVETFLLLAKSARGRAAADLISKVIEEPGLYAFGEFLDLPGVKELATSSEWAPAHRTLELFAYGTHAQYAAAAAGTYVKLSDAGTRKLQALSVVSAAQGARSIPYATLMAELGMPNVRALEDLLITECMYTGVVKGKLDQKLGALHVTEAIGRDLKPEELPELIAKLDAWEAKTGNILKAIEASVELMAQESQKEKSHAEKVEKEVYNMKMAIKHQMDACGAPHDPDAGMDMDTGDMLDAMDEDGPSGAGVAGSQGMGTASRISKRRSRGPLGGSKS